MWPPLFEGPRNVCLYIRFNITHIFQCKFTYFRICIFSSKPRVRPPPPKKKLFLYNTQKCLNPELDCAADRAVAPRSTYVFVLLYEGVVPLWQGPSQDSPACACISLHQAPVSHRSSFTSASCLVCLPSHFFTNLDRVHVTIPQCQTPCKPCNCNRYNTHIHIQLCCVFIQIKNLHTCDIWRHHHGNCGEYWLLGLTSYNCVEIYRRFGGNCRPNLLIWRLDLLPGRWPRHFMRWGCQLLVTSPTTHLPRPDLLDRRNGWRCRMYSS
jgi:hypothetical protein